MKKILIFHTAFIGDIVLSTPLIKKIKAKYPNSEITYATTPAGAQILANNPLLKDVISYDKRGKDKGIKGMLRLAKKLKGMNFDMAYIPHRYLRSSFITFLSGIKERIGYDISGGRLFLTEKRKYIKNSHEVERLLALVDFEDFDDKKIELYPTNDDYKYINNIFSDYKLENKKIIAMAVGSKWYTKMWPTKYFNELIKKLLERDDIQIVLVGGKDELELDICEDKRIINMINKTSLLQLAALISKADILLTNDSSPIHIASAFDTYILSIFGATVKSLGFYPWSANSEVMENEGLPCRPCGLHGGQNCPEGHFKCMMEIKPEMVYLRILELLEKR